MKQLIFFLQLLIRINFVFFQVRTSVHLYREHLIKTVIQNLLNYCDRSSNKKTHTSLKCQYPLWFTVNDLSQGCPQNTDVSAFSMHKGEQPYSVTNPFFSLSLPLWVILIRSGLSFSFSLLHFLCCFLLHNVIKDHITLSISFTKLSSQIDIDHQYDSRIINNQSAWSHWRSSRPWYLESSKMVNISKHGSDRYLLFWQIDK